MSKKFDTEKTEGTKSKEAGECPLDLEQLRKDMRKHYITTLQLALNGELTEDEARILNDKVTKIEQSLILLIRLEEISAEQRISMERNAELNRILEVVIGSK